MKTYRRIAIFFAVALLFLAALPFAFVATHWADYEWFRIVLSEHGAQCIMALTTVDLALAVAILMVAFKPKS